MPRQPAAFARLTRALAEPETLSDSPWTTAETPEVLGLAGFHRVSGLLAEAFTTAQLTVPDELAALRQKALARHLAMLRVLGRAARALDGARIAWSVVKGPVLATRWYGTPAGRDYYDLDLLVPPAGFGRAIAELEGIGFGHANRNWSGFRAIGMGEVPLTDGTTTIDLHWHLVTFARDRRVLHLPTAELLDRRVPVQLGSVAASTLADDDTVAHVLLHAGLAGARLLVHLCDVRAVATQVDGLLAARRLHELDLDRVAAVVIERTNRILGPVGGVGTATLGSRSWCGLNAGVDRVWEHLVPGARNPLPAFLISATRPTVTQTMKAVVATGATSVRRRLGLATMTSPGGQLDMDLDGGGVAERDRFLRDVATGAYGA